MNVFIQPSASTGWRVMRATKKPRNIRPKNGRTRPMTSDMFSRASSFFRAAVTPGLPARQASGIELHVALRQIWREAWTMNDMKTAKFAIGQVVRHRLFPFRGIIFDVDPQFNNTEEWYQAIPKEVRPRKDQPFYHLLAENSETEYIAYVSE